ncbi:hypothetical protein M422DRAFT_64733 [Sphaerobolus stellatus SS14]|nr:hypothetical protein M422DRAFT_64733 [Sphaerobolus stellatus SS14]
MADVLTYAISSDFSSVPLDLHPTPGILSDIQSSIALTDYEVALHFTITFFAFKLICTKPNIWEVETTDIKLFRVLLHAMTNPDIKFPSKIFEILLNLAAFRISIDSQSLGPIFRPFEAGVLALCVAMDIRFVELLDRACGPFKLFSTLDKAGDKIAKGQETSLLWLRIYSTLQALYQIFLLVPGLSVDLDMAINLLKLVFAIDWKLTFSPHNSLTPPTLIKQQFRHALIHAIGAVFCSSPVIFQNILPYQRGSIRVCLDTLRAWTEADTNEAQKTEMEELCRLLNGICLQ